MKPSIVLLDPPGGRNYGRDGYLGGELEPELRLPAQDLVCLSGLLSAHARLSVVDSMAEGLSSDQAVERVAGRDPDFVFFVLSAASYGEDTPFLRKLKVRCPRAKFVGLGEVYRDIGETAFELHPFLDAVLLDFTTRDVLSLLGGADGAADNVIRRSGRGLIRGPQRHHFGPWNLPTPRWDLFPLSRYRWPFAPEGPRATLLTEFGCPFLCTYCPASSLSHKMREIDAVIEEAERLKALGVRGVFFQDQTFASSRRRALELLERLARGRYGFSWVCSTRVDLVDESLLAAMKAAGCAAVSYGIDSADDELLRVVKKNATLRQARRALELTRRCGLKAWGTFLIGFALDTRESIERTLDFAREEELDHVSWRVESQRYAADYRRDLLVKGLVPPEAMPPDTPTSISVWQGRLGVSNQDAFAYFGRARRGPTRRLVSPECA